jgi:ribosomal protein S18 acetylase RimI-like enzyme
MRNSNDISERHAEFNGWNIREVTTAVDIERLSQFAGRIWRDHYRPIIGNAQVEYMLANFQSPSGIARQCAAGYQYFWILEHDLPLAYFAWIMTDEDQSLQLSKLYVDKNHRRHGLGRHIIQLAADYGLKHDLSLLWLTVNRHNQTAIDFYLGNGFVNTESLVQDIGGGFVMDDFKMVKQLTD